jgi:hypothetical protein
MLMTPKRANWLFALIVVVYIGYAAAFIYNTSVEVNGVRYFTLFDDAMISMRYAKNLAQGYGLVWNPGETPVEGYTNPLWVVYMAIFHLLPIDPRMISLYIQISAAVLLVINLFIVRRLAYRLTGSQVAALIAVIFTAFSLQLNTWSLQGMEVCVLAPLISLTVLLLVESMQADRFSVWPYVLLGIGTLVRIDVLAPYVAVVGFMLFNDRVRWKQHLLYGVGVLLTFFVPMTLFRLAYYGDYLPNTYYLKVTGYPILLRVLNGLHYAVTYISRVGIFALAIYLFRRDRLIRLIGWLVIVQMLYSIYVGGDAWDYWSQGANRYVSIALPLLFVLFAAAFVEVWNRLRAALNTPRDRRFLAYGALVFGIFSLIIFNSLYGPDAVGEWLLLNSGLLHGDDQNMVARSVLTTEITTDKARVAVVWAGILPYFTNRPAVDLLGKSDVRIAHMQARSEIAEHNPYLQLGLYYPGHMKWDYAYSIGQLKPDLVIDLWKAPWEADPYLKADYVKIKLGSDTAYALKNSPNILWGKVTPAS